MPSTEILPSLRSCNHLFLKETRKNKSPILTVFPRLARLLVFPRLQTSVCFLALGTCCLFSRVWHRLQVFVRGLHWLYVFSSLVMTGCVFSRAWHRMYGFPRLALVACFAALGIFCVFREKSVPFNNHLTGF